MFRNHYSLEERKNFMNTAIFLADGFEEIEGLTVVDMFRRAGIPIQTVSISDSLTVTGSHDIKVQADCLLADFDFNYECCNYTPSWLSVFSLKVLSTRS